MRFQIQVRSGIKLLAEVQGMTVPENAIMVADLQKVIEVEQFLERLTGYRVHINEARGEKKVKVAAV